MAREDLPEIPSFAASREEAVASAPRGAAPARSKRGGSSGGGGLFARLVATLGLVAAAVACAWAWQLQEALDLSQTEARSLSARVADLEALLTDTDESVEKSAAALGAQLSVVDKEARRLEQRRREMDVRIEKLEKTAASLDSRADELVAADATIKKDLTALTRLAGDLERISGSAQRAQSDVERIADGLNKSNLERAALTKRVTANEEWIESINAFRRQVNAKISTIEQQMRATPAPDGTLQ